MWTIYDIHRDLYWNEQHHNWCSLEQASRYSVEERDHVPLPSLRYQWRFISLQFPKKMVATAQQR